MIGQLQGFIPRHAFLVTRDRVSNPFPVAIGAAMGQPLDVDLAQIRDHYADIITNGAGYVPWTDAVVAYNLSHEDEKWHTAKQTIAKDRFPGGDPELVYQIRSNIKAQLSTYGFPSISTLLG